MKRNGADGEPRPRLRIAGYVQGHAEPVADPDPFTPPAAAVSRRPPLNLPNIADYWPDAGRQPPEPSGPGATTVTTGNRRPAVLATLLAAVVTVGTFLLSRPLTGPEEPRPVAAAPTTAVVPVSLAPSESPAEPPPAPTAEAPAPKAPTTAPPKPPPPITAARFELVTGVTELSVRTADLDGATFRVTTPKDSGLDVDARFTDGTLRVRTEPDGSDSGSGRVDVLLSDTVVWRLRMGAGVHTWRISTSEKVPVTVALGGGAGALTVYGHDRGGVRGGETVRDGDPNDRPGLDIDAEAGIGSLKIGRD
ncbi:hypothetical protein [Actinoplanes utahensis]|uniref:hypothetical protein n=1 Tax=Actinoplanes utahensis TaxID=1869 RepID=UPI000A946704|nr:hypothetical protein [Actinoplanes utahensis]